MKSQELAHIIAAVFILAIVSGFSFAFKSDLQNLLLAFIFSIIIIALSILAKKLTAYLLDADVEHEIWHMKNFGFSKDLQLKKPIPTGIIFPLIITAFSLGSAKFLPLLTYETRALKHRAAKRFGFYSFKEMTDWHNAVIGASGIIVVLILSLITYFSPFPALEYFSKISVYYAFWNLLPISKLDGAQIFFGSRILWTVLFSIAVIGAFLALIAI